MILWKEPSDLSKEFLAQNYPIRLFDIFHQIKALFLFPESKDEETRAKIVLSLNLDLFHKLREKHHDLMFVTAFRYLLQIPEENYLARHFIQAYPIWLIDEGFKQKEEENQLKRASLLVWTLLRISKSHLYAGIISTEASVKQALEIILGKTPLRSKVKKSMQEDYLCGEKGFIKFFNLYKPICHFVAAYEHLKEKKGKGSDFMSSPEDIQHFLNLAHGLRDQLLLIQTPNIKSKTLFTEETLVPLPSWIKLKEIEIAIEPIEEKVKELKYLIDTAIYIEPKTHRTSAKILPR